MVEPRKKEGETEDQSGDLEMRYQIYQNPELKR
jgi:hypothetical protein